MCSKYAGNLRTIAALWKRMSSDFWPLVLSLFTWRALLKQRKLHIAFKCRSRELQYISVSALYVPARLEICSAHPEWSALKLFFSFEIWLFRRRILFSCLFLFTSFNRVYHASSLRVFYLAQYCVYTMDAFQAVLQQQIFKQKLTWDVIFLGEGCGEDKFCNSLHPARICKPAVIFRSQQCRLKPPVFICVRDTEQGKGRVKKRKKIKSLRQMRLNARTLLLFTINFIEKMFLLPPLSCYQEECVLH